MIALFGSLMETAILELKFNQKNIFLLCYFDKDFTIFKNNIKVKYCNKVQWKLQLADTLRPREAEKLSATGADRL